MKNQRFFNQRIYTVAQSLLAMKKGKVSYMKSNWKSQVAKVTGTNPKFDRKVLTMKKSWDEVSSLLNSSVKKKKKK